MWKGFMFYDAQHKCYVMLEAMPVVAGGQKTYTVWEMTSHQSMTLRGTIYREAAGLWRGYDGMDPDTAMGYAFSSKRKAALHVMSLGILEPVPAEGQGS
jgi:hypothetical protein